MSDESIGNSIYQAFKLVDKVGHEINSLSRVIENEFVESFEVNKGQYNIKLVGVIEEHDEFSESLWIYEGYAISFGIACAPRGKKARRYLSVQFALTGECMTSSFYPSEQPLVHICFWDEPVNLDSTYMGMELDVPMPEMAGDSLLYWPEYGNTGISAQWTYSILLTSLNSRDDVRKKIVKPFWKLVSGEVDSVNLDFDGLIKYKLHDNGFCQPRLESQGKDDVAGSSH